MCESKFFIYKSKQNSMIDLKKFESKSEFGLNPNRISNPKNILEKPNLNQTNPIYLFKSDSKAKSFYCSLVQLQI